MSSVAIPAVTSADSPEARRYNRIRRWLGVADFVLGLAYLFVLLVTGWSGTLRDLAYRGAFQNYALAVFLYVVMLMAIGKLLGFGLDYYGFRLERRFQLSNMRFRAWLWDEVKGFGVGVVLAALVVELLYLIIRQSSQYWWFIAWAVFLGMFVVLAQLAPIVLFPIFYKFAPLENEELKARLVRLSERAGTRVRGVYQWKLSEKSKKANAALTGLGSTMVLAMVTLAVMGYLFLARRPRVAWMLLGAVLGGVALNSILKFTFARPRPDFIIHAEWVFTPSFPSGHATLSAITYSTIGVLLAQIHSSRRLRVYLISMTALLILLIGMSRICLGVHYPTDVVGGWCIGVAWAMACWELMVWLQGSRSGRNRLISPDVQEPWG